MNDLIVPDAFRTWNAQRAVDGGRLRQAIATLMRKSPDILAREVIARLDAAAYGRTRLRKRAVQLHMQAIRRNFESFATPPW